MNGEYGAMTVRGAQGAFPNGSYPFGSYRKVLREMKHFTAVRLVPAASSLGGSSCMMLCWCALSVC
eukprot:COSAG06_NODE_3218_length_5663_cov_8.989216_3_plen_66_part_00